MFLPPAFYPVLYILEYSDPILYGNVSVLFQATYVSGNLRLTRPKMADLGSCNINVRSKLILDFLKFFSNIGKTYFHKIFKINKIHK